MAGVRKTKVEIDLTGEDKAIAGAKRLDKEVKKVTKDAKQATREAEKAKASGKGLRGRFGKLLDRAKARGILKEESLVFGGIELGREGFKIEEEAKKGKRGMGLGSLAAKSFTIASIAGHGIGGTLNKIADVSDFIAANKHLTTGQVAMSLATGASQSLYEVVGARSILTGILRLSGEASGTIDTAFDQAFGDDTLDRQILANTNRIQRLRAANIKRDEAEAEREEAFVAAQAKSIEEINKRAVGLSAKIIRPRGIKFDSYLNERFQKLHREAVERDRTDSVARVSKQTLETVSQGEGR